MISFPKKNTGYGVVWSYEYLISSGTKSSSAREDFYKLVERQSTCGLKLLFVFDVAFVIGKYKGWILLTTVSICLSFF